MASAIQNFSNGKYARSMVNSHKQTQTIPRRILVVVSDGLDTDSKTHTLASVQSLARQLEVAVYFVVLSESILTQANNFTLWDIGGRVKMAVKGRQALEDFALGTGGRFFSFRPDGKFAKWSADAAAVSLALVSEIYWTYEVTAVLPAAIDSRKTTARVEVQVDEKILNRVGTRPPLAPMSTPLSQTELGGPRPTIFNSDKRLVDYAPKRPKSPIEIREREQAKVHTENREFTACTSCSIGAPRQIAIQRAGQ